jgi:hypothetical protein
MKAGVFNHGMRGIMTINFPVALMKINNSLKNARPHPVPLPQGEGEAACAIGYSFRFVVAAHVWI